MSKVCKNGPPILIPHPDTCNATWLISFLCAYLHTLPFSPQSQQLIHIQKSMDDSWFCFFYWWFRDDILKKPYPPRVFTKKPPKNSSVSPEHQPPPRKRRTKRTFDSCFCAAFRLPPWIEGSKASSLRMENEAIRYTQVFF